MIVVNHLISSFRVTKGSVAMLMDDGGMWFDMLECEIRGQGAGVRRNSVSSVYPGWWSLPPIKIGHQTHANQYHA